MRNGLTRKAWIAEREPERDGDDRDQLDERARCTPLLALRHGAARAARPALGSSESVSPRLLGLVLGAGRRRPRPPRRSSSAARPPPARPRQRPRPRPRRRPRPRPRGLAGSPRRPAPPRPSSATGASASSGVSDLGLGLRRPDRRMPLGSRPVGSGPGVLALADAGARDRPGRAGSRAWRGGRRRGWRPRSARSSASAAGTCAPRRRRTTACGR